MIKEQDVKSSNLVLSAAGSLLAVALADLFFYNHPLGWTLGGYVFFLTAATAFIRRVFIPRPTTWILILGLTGLGVALVEDTGFLPCLLASLGLSTLAMNQREDKDFDLFRWLIRLASFGSLGWLQPAKDIMDAGYSFLLRPGHPISWVRKMIWTVLLFLFCLIFLSLFSEANPVLEQWTKSF